MTEEAGKLLALDSAHLIIYERDQTATVVASWNLGGPRMPVGTRVPVEGDNIIGRVFRTQQPARIDDYSMRQRPGSRERPLPGDSRGGRGPGPGRRKAVGGDGRRLLAAGAAARGNRDAHRRVHRAGRHGDREHRGAPGAGASRRRAGGAWPRRDSGGRSRPARRRVHRGGRRGRRAVWRSAGRAVPLRAGRDGHGDRRAGNVAPYLGRPWPCPPGDPGLVASIQRTGRPLRIDDYTQINSAISGPAREAGIRKAAGVPVIVSGRVWGAMAVVAGHEHPPLRADTLDRLAGFTELMATAIANSDARTEIERLAQEQAALRRIATLVARGADTGEIFAAVAREVSEVMHLPVAGVQRYEDDETTTVIASLSDRPHPYQPGTRWPYHAAGLAGQVRQTGRAGRVVDYSHRRGAFAAKAREVGLHSVAAAPIIVDGAVWGLVTIASTDGPLPDQAEDRLAAFTELVGTAIANTQSRTELSASRARIVAAADETRRRLERDLHDGIQQRLVSLALKARTIETTTPQPAGQIQGELSRLADGLGTALDELREISRGIHPAILSEAGLGPALKALARRSAVPVEVDLSLSSRPAEHLQVAGYYIASEALTNTAKHAQASVITMRVDGRDGALTLSIRDDGIGGADPSRGSGIIGLKDRVEALGGTISVLSPPGHGTTVHVHLPAAPTTAPAVPRAAPPGATP